VTPAVKISFITQIWYRACLVPLARELHNTKDVNVQQGNKPAEISRRALRKDGDSTPETTIFAGRDHALTLTTTKKVDGLAAEHGTVRVTPGMKALPPGVFNWQGEIPGNHATTPHKNKAIR